MADNILNARIKLKYDSLTNWNNSTFSPLAGEVCIAYITTNSSINGGAEGTQVNQPRAIGIKVGDGAHTFANLPWVQAVAADVYNWAKQSTPPTASQLSATKTLTDSTTQVTTIEAWLQSLSDDMNSLSGGAGSISSQISNAIAQLDSNSTTNTLTGTPSVSYTLSAFEQKDGVVEATFSPIQITESQVTDLETHLGEKAPINNPTFTGTVTLPADPTTDLGAATKRYVDSKTAGLSNAMHFKGKSTVDLSLAENSAANPTITGYDWTKKEAGDVVLNSVGNKEFVWDGSKWIELGDESSFAVKGSITNADIANNAAIDQNKIANLTTDLAAKQDELGFTTGTAYNKTSNPVATKDYVDNKAAAVNTTYTFSEGDSDGEIKITPSAGGTAGTSVNVKPKNLHKIATSGSIYNIEEGSNTTTTGNVRYLILDCGTAEILID